ncbi:hypothetical protein SAMN04488001_2285 [Litoreibacter albidus]|uniref:Uncharacterized protein n=2 Tax=Litoreibacter albidus TaxID=670155 RepID=A0A1H2YCA8_9RHOB|nr:hypothetical protein SAMN04488001_2285 [Litoreibacter albidus]
MEFRQRASGQLPWANRNEALTMPNAHHDIAFTPAVKAMRTVERSRKIYAKYEASPKAMKTELTGPEMARMGARIAA